MDQSFLAIVRLIFVVLVSGGGDKDAMQTRVSADLYPAKAPIYAQANIGVLRTMVATDKDMKAALYGDQKPADVSAQAVDALAKMIGAEKTKIAPIVANLRSVGVWYLAMGEDELQQRVLVALDFKKKVDLVEVINAATQGQANHVQQKLGDWAVHQFVFGRRAPQLWMAQREGLVFMAMDPLAVKLAARTNAQMPKARALAKDAPLMVAEADGVALTNQLLPLMGRHDRDEFYVFAEAFDLSAYKTLKAELTATGLKAVLEVEADSVPATILKPAAKGSRLLKMLPKKGAIGFVAAVQDPKAIMAQVEASIKPLLRQMGGRSPIDMFRRELNREMGIDFDKDLIGNLAAGGIVVIAPQGERDLERKATFLLEAKDAAKARTTFEKILTMAGGKGEDVSVETLRDKGKMTEMNNGRVKFGIHKNIVAFSGGRNLSTDEVTKLMVSGVRKEENKTGLLAAAVVDVSKMVPFKIKPVYMTLSRQKNTFVLQSDFQIKSLVPLLGKPGKPGEIMPFMAKGIIVNNMGDLKQIALGCLMYSGDQGGKFPPNLKALKPDYLPEGKVYLWKNPATGEEKERYIYCPGLRDDNARPTRTMLGADPKPYKGQRSVMFVDGHAERFSENRFQAMAKQQGWKPGIGVAKKDIPKVKQEEIRALCRKLSSDKFKERSAAKKKLKELGQQAWPILGEFKNHKDPEVRLVIKQLLEGK